MQWSDLRTDVCGLADEVAAMLTGAPTADRAVPGSEWTVAEVGAHLVTVARRYGIHARDEAVERPQSEGGWQEAMASFNAVQLDEYGPRDDLETVAAALTAENDALLEALGADGARPIAWFDVPMTAHDLTAVWMGELLIHGLDLARALGRGWPITAAQAAAVFDGISRILPTVTNTDVARTAAGTYHLRLRGFTDYTIEVGRDGSVRLESGRPPRADVHISASPVAYVLVGYGRENQWPAIAKGKITAWGRKPWLALKFADLFERP